MFFTQFDCTSTLQNDSLPENDARWFGLQKANETDGLMDLIKTYIVYMLIVTMHAFILLRQFQMRTMKNIPQPLAKLLFPTTTRPDAEKNLEGMLKYLFNYGFYKFGFEITLIVLVSCIAYRMDIVAIVYAIWLSILVLLRRRRCAKIWTVFLCFVACAIFLEYILFVGLPPGFCLGKFICLPI